MCGAQRVIPRVAVGRLFVLLVPQHEYVAVVCESDIGCVDACVTRALVDGRHVHRWSGRASGWDEVGAQAVVDVVDDDGIAGAVQRDTWRGGERAAGIERGR